MNGSISLPLLDRIQVASPCTARWEDMVGDERVRRCAECNLNVHNFSAMTRDEAEGVLAGLAHGRVCGWFYRRADGTVLTQDCPVGVARVRAAARRALVRVAALIGLVGVAGVAAGMTVFGYGGGGHSIPADLEREGARVFDYMSDLPALLFWRAR